MTVTDVAVVAVDARYLPQTGSLREDNLINFSSCLLCQIKD
jgi:hypothetical protein